MQINKYRCLGIDPGYTGAAVYAEFSDISRCKDFRVLEFKDYTYTEKKQKTKQVEYMELIDSLDNFMDAAEIIVMEKVKAMPKDGGTSAFNFGFFTGTLRAICESHNYYQILRDEFITPEEEDCKILNPTPQVWKRNIGLFKGATKRDSVNLAVELFPDFKEEFYGPRGGIKDGVAEAALLATYGLKYLWENNND
jgi:hypothetical protein